jgi:hypothetical protein
MMDNKFPSVTKGEKKARGDHRPKVSYRSKIDMLERK